MLRKIFQFMFFVWIMATNEIYDSDIPSKSVSDSSGMWYDNVYSYTNDY